MIRGRLVKGERLKGSALSDLGFAWEWGKYEREAARDMAFYALNPDWPADKVPPSNQYADWQKKYDKQRSKRVQAP